ncbi:MAG: hypothetical protein DYG89_10945 [Caldilinea sp. CFX5]|nr:hypothetical protein [Caldilinea sp. CFX5]
MGQTTSSHTASSVTPVDFNAYNTKLPQHRLNLPVYCLARTPVTNAQFRPFVVANGYTTQAFWSAAGWEWRTQNKISEPRFWNDNMWLDNYANYANMADNSPAGNARRVVRGGSWFIGPNIVRAASRRRYAPDFRNDSLGFRVVLVLSPR